MTKRSTIVPDLIYDIGMHDGSDTGFYLLQGYRVLAVEANPLLAERARRRFAPEVASGRLTILNVGISDHCGQATFWVCDDALQWSSFDRRIAAREGCQHHGVEIPAVSVGEILGEWGVPHYMKVEIEGADILCARALAGGIVPPFISLASECVGDSENLSETEALSTLRALQDAGYRRFKLISMKDLSSAGNAMPRLLARLLHSAAYDRLRVLRLSTLAKFLIHRGRVSRKYGYDFRPGTTGPWGEAAAGQWLSADQAEGLLLRMRRRHFRDPVPKYSFWYHWHAAA